MEKALMEIGKGDMTENICSCIGLLGVNGGLHVMEQSLFYTR